MDEVEKQLRRRKNAFLDRIEAKINNYIISTRKNCIAVVERNSDGSVCCTWDFDDDIDDLCKHVYLFMRKKRSSSGRVHDSALTDPIIKIVTEEYQDFYASESENITKGVLVALAEDEVKLQDFVDRLSNIAVGTLKSTARSLVVQSVKRQIKESVEQGALLSVGQQIGHLATTVAGSQVAGVVAHILVKLLAVHISSIVAHILASSALQHILVVLLKKFVIAAVISAVSNFLIAHFGAALAGASIMWVVIPIIAGFMAYEIHHFPKELGEKVSASVRSELEGRFDNMNETILENIFDSILRSNDLVKDIADDEEFRDAMRKLGKEVEPGLEKFSFLKK
ncbi:hypothetical protein P154DRAFT_615012 [Amniculicola lignicola CBS 123094]|uniref:Uncharacterized protein n=1 Tax=Amniculicola lignicola CBS 123094 TaxID=1392246 RepID=A0A6A5X2B9_9PLEO|nr:hypothetical protein P154DRAFT_615012 [Amniculicola lignicola CBS 123094]